MSPEDESPAPLFALAKQYPFFTRSARHRKLSEKLDHILGLDELSAMVDSIPLGHPIPYQGACQFLDLTLEGDKGFAANIPKTGPTIVVANHPYGPVDPLVASWLTLASRPDTLIFGNAVLTHPVHEKCFLPVEILDQSPAATRLNLSSMRRALGHLKSGGCVLIFPAGEVERYRWSSLQIEEGAWTLHMARLAQKSKATIFPVGFTGENPLWFHLPGAFHKTLRLLALPRVTLSHRGKTISLRAGKPLHLSHLPGDPVELTNSVRNTVLGLANREIKSDRK